MEEMQMYDYGIIRKLDRRCFQIISFPSKDIVIDDDYAISVLLTSQNTKQYLGKFYYPDADGQAAWWDRIWHTYAASSSGEPVLMGGVGWIDEKWSPEI